MSINKKLEKWRAAGVIDEATLLAISAYESTRSGLRFSTAMFGIGALAIFLGIAAIVASNWTAIPALIKLSAHGAVNLGLAVGILYAMKHEKEALREILAFLLGGLTLTFIALIGQIYQTGAPLWQALILWLALISPFMFWVAKARFTILSWSLALIVTAQQLYEPLAAFAPRSIAAFYTLAFFALLGLCQNIKVRTRWTETMGTFCFAFMAIAASIGQIFWAIPFHAIGNEPVMPSPALAMGAGLGATALLYGLRRARVLIACDPLLDVFTALSVFACFLPALMTSHAPRAYSTGPAFEAIGAVCFMAYWALAGWTALRLGRHNLLRLAVLLIAARLIIVYFELFGSLLTTGIGLVSTGMVLIAFVAALRHILGRFAKQGANL